MKKYFNTVLDIMEGRKPGRSFLRALSFLYQGGVALRNLAYDKGWLRSHDVGLPVISVGNIVAGGTGKTPLVKFLASQLMSDIRVAILSRGYGSLAERGGRNFRVTPEMSAAECGDEPLWLARQLPRVQVWVGKNRTASALQAKAQGAELLILDDGMQHRQLKRDVEIVVMQGDDPWGKGFFLPRGFLRDSPKRLKSADLIVVMGAEAKLDVQAPVVVAQTKIPLQLEGKKVALLCAIGSPERFVKAIEGAGGQVVAKWFKPDHEPFSEEEVQAFAKSSRADVVVCTEKDGVKLPPDLPVVIAPSVLEISGNISAWNEMMQKIYTGVNNVRL